MYIYIYIIFNTYTYMYLHNHTITHTTYTYFDPLCGTMANICVIKNIFEIYIYIYKFRSLAKEKESNGDHPARGSLIPNASDLPQFLKPTPKSMVCPSPAADGSLSCQQALLRKQKEEERFDIKKNMCILVKK